MVSQQAEITETIANLKKALRREKESPSSQPIYSTTNRGNKLKKGASFVHTGKLAYTNGSCTTKQRIEHAGYTRYILERNPRRYNEFGEELADSESDEEADGDATEENPYGNIRLEEILCPLRYPYELAVHPTLSIPYLDSALPDMVKNTEEKLRQERANLWRAKNLNRQLLGDEAWVPCEKVESTHDWEVFEPRQQPVNGLNGRKRKIRSDSSSNVIPDGVWVQDHAILEANTVAAIEPASIPNGHTEAHLTETAPKVDVLEKNLEAKTEAEVDARPNGNNQSADDPAETRSSKPETNGIAIHDNESDHREEQNHHDEAVGESEDRTVSDGADAMDEDKMDRHSDSNSPVPPTRRITRALAATNDISNTQTPPLSPTPTLTTSSNSSSLQVDPLYLVPDSFHNSRKSYSLYNLPAEEAIETRRLLTTFIQKQEESVRGYEALLAKLIKAQRLRDAVWEMCKAEGHIGEMSDGEDWIDYDRWNLQPGELRKGRYEEEDTIEETGIGGRKGKRRRNQ